MAIRTIITRGFGNGTFNGTIPLVSLRGYVAGEEVLTDSLHYRVDIAPALDYQLDIQPAVEYTIDIQPALIYDVEVSP